MTLLVAMSGGVNLALLGALLTAGTRLNSDFMAFWAYPRVTAGSTPELIYRAFALMSFEQHLYPGFQSFYPCLYPPTMLMALSWLRLLPFGAAEMIWSLLGIAALALGTRALFSSRRWMAVAALLASPAALLCLATGQTALFTTALLLAGFACLPRHPAWAGFWFGLLTLKPQLGILVAVFLLARGSWMAIFVACLVALCMAGLSCLALPPDLWLLWLKAMPAYQSDYFQATSLNMNTMITPAANLVVLGVGQKAAWATQALCGLVMVLVTVWAAKRARYRLAVAITLIATFLVQPHAYAYDSVAVVAALALALEARPGPIPLGLGVITYLAPLMLLSSAAHWFLYAPLLAACLLTLAWMAGNSEESSHEPAPLLPPAAT